MKNTRIKEIIIKEVSTTNTDERFMKQILLETLYEILESKQKGESVWMMIALTRESRR